MFHSRFWRRATVASAALFLTSSALLATPASAAAVLQPTTGSGNGTVFASFPSSGVPLLRQFGHFFQNGDHPLQRIAEVPLPQQSAIEVTLADKNSDDPYNFNIVHQMVDPAGIQTGSLRGACTNQCTVNIARPAGAVFVLTGFRFAFSNGEHPLNRIAVFESSGQLTTSFRDQNGDDPYTYEVSYAWVPQSRLGIVAPVVNRVHAAGTTSAPAARGDKVIRGFSIVYAGGGAASDNNVRDLGITPTLDNINIHFSDNNPGDSPDWLYSVYYATVI